MNAAEFSDTPLTAAEFWEAAAQWGSCISAGDPGACLYGFSERGMVQSEEHRAHCIAHIETMCREAADVNDDPAADHKMLDQMVEYLRKAPLAT